VFDGVAEALEGSDPRVAFPRELCREAHPAPIIWSKTRSGVSRTNVRFRRPCRMISWPAANGMRRVRPSSATQSPVVDEPFDRLAKRHELCHHRSGVSLGVTLTDPTSVTDAVRNTDLCAHVQLNDGGVRRVGP
jgi:hypothetical protein